MKLWEVIKELTEDPTKRFEAKMLAKDWTVCMSVDTKLPRYFKFEVFNGKKLIDQSLVGGAFNGNVALELDWQPVRQPVTWQEAIQAWVDGKKVVWEEDAERRVFDRNKSWPFPKYQYQFLDQDLDAVTVRMITNGTWYVED